MFYERRDGTLSILISIQPEYVDRIIGKEKVFDIRKLKPKRETPFKCLIYETTKKYKTRLFGLNCICQGRGKIVGEFICDKIIEFESEFWDDETFESIGTVYYDEDFGEREVRVFACNGEDNELCKKSCLTWAELRKYIGGGN